MTLSSPSAAASAETVAAEASCPSCGATPLQPLLDAGLAPVLCNVLWPSRDEALAAPRGRIVLALCRRCGLISNAAFDPDLVVYSPAYHNSLHGSPTFQRYVEGLVERLIATHGLRGKRIVEIGAGSGEFLKRLCEAGGNEGVGFDPSHDVAADDVDVDIAARSFDGDSRVVGDFVVCQHVLEHVWDPGALLDDLARSVRRADGGAPPAYFEVPDATYMLERGAVWDVIYEHCTYFSAPALRHLMTTRGYALTASGRAFGDQYLWAEVLPDAAEAPAPARPEELERLAAAASAFGRRFADAVSAWQQRLQDEIARGRVALWGAGSKGVAFLNAVPAAAGVAAVVDVNRRKHGLHVPGSGQQVVGPQQLRDDPPDLVIAMNPLYRDEIAALLQDLGISAPVEVV